MSKSELADLLFADEPAPFDYVMELNKLVAEGVFDDQQPSAIGQSVGDELCGEVMRCIGPHSEVVAGWRQSATD